MRKNLHGNRYHAVAADGAVDWDHPLNSNPQGKRVGWWVTLPGLPSGGGRLLNLADPKGQSHGTLTGQTPTLPIWNGAPLRPGGLGSLFFTAASSQYIAASAPALTTGFSWAAWVRPLVVNTNQIVVSQALTSGYAWRLTSSGTMALLKQGVSQSTASNTALVAGAWSRIGLAWSFDGTSGPIRYYLNGRPDGSQSAASAGASTTAFRIGTRDTLAEYFGGGLDDVSVWSGALLDAHFAADYAQSLVGYRVPDSPLRWFSTRTVSVPAATGIQFDAASNSGYQAASASYSWSHTNAGNFLAVDVSLLSVPGTSVTGITYNGLPLTKIGSQYTGTSIGGVECWGLVSPPVGTFTIAVTLSASIISSGEAVSYSGVDTVVPTESFNGAFATNVGAADATVTITPITDSTWIHGAVATTDSSITANQTSRNNVTGAGGSGGDEDSGAAISPAAATATSWTNVGALATWAIGGYALRPIQPFDYIPYDLVHSPQHQAMMAM